MKLEIGTESSIEVAQAQKGRKDILERENSIERGSST